jgi:hypothetical protein
MRSEVYRRAGWLSAFASGPRAANVLGALRCLPGSLSGCIAAAGSYGETVKLIHEAIEFHIEGMLLHGEHVPAPTTLAELVEVG